MRDFERSLPMILLKARESVMRKFLPSLREHDLSPQQWRVLRVLQEEDWLDATEIAERCSLLMPSLSRILQNLQRRGLIKRAPSRSDQRRSQISITDEGRKLFACIAPISEERYAYITERFGEQRLETLYALLYELIDSLDEEESENPVNKQAPPA